MTIGQLKAILNQYSDDTIVKLTYECDNSYRDITKVEYKPLNYPFLSIETDVVPNFEDISVMASAALDKYESIMLKSEIELLEALV